MKCLHAIALVLLWLCAAAPLLGPETVLVTMINGVPWWYFQRLGGDWEGRALESVDPGGSITL